jgi:ribosome-associated heat shock protein Hsp15
MRIDKYLWAVRYYKSRNAASTACRKGYVQLGGLNAKPSRQQLTVEIYVLDIPKSRVGAKLVPQYCKDITPQEALDIKDAADENQRLSRVKGAGRPSKKDRRDLDDFLDDDA